MIYSPADLWLTGMDVSGVDPGPLISRRAGDTIEATMDEYVTISLNSYNSLVRDLEHFRKRALPRVLGDIERKKLEDRSIDNYKIIGIKIKKKNRTCWRCGAKVKADE